MFSWWKIRQLKSRLLASEEFFDKVIFDINSKLRMSIEHSNKGKFFTMHTLVDDADNRHYSYETHEIIDMKTSNLVRKGTYPATFGNTAKKG